MLYLPEGPIIVKTFSLHNLDLHAWWTANGPVSTIFDTAIYMPREKALEARIQWNKTLWQKFFDRLSCSCDI